jgi:GntR family transcriptional regulator
MGSRREPAYRRIATSFKREVRAGRLRAGQKLPSESELMSQFGVSRITVRNAIAILAAEGLVETRHGSGTFVNQPPVPYQLYRLSSFEEVMRGRGLEPGSTVRAYELRRAPVEVAEALGGADEAYRLERLRLVDGQPLCYDVTWLPAAIGERLTADELAARTLYDLYENRLGLRVVGASHEVEALTASTGTARLLDVHRGSPMLVVERLTQGEAGRPLDWQRRYYRADRFRLELELLRHPLPWPSGEAALMSHDPGQGRWRQDGLG